MDVLQLKKQEFFQRFEGFKLGFPLKQPYCNSTCSHCYIGSKDAYVDDEEYKKRRKMIDEIVSVSQELEIRKISIVGTEPTLESDLISMIDWMMGERIIVTMSTNGWYTGSEKSFKISEKEYKDGKSFLDDIIYDYFTFGVMVSIDGIGKVHDQFRNMPGLYERAIRTLDYAKGLCVPLATGVEIVIHPYNYHQIREIVEEVIKHNIQLIKIMPVFGVGFGRDIKPFTVQERAQIQETLADLVVPIFSYGVKFDFANFEKEFPVFSIENLNPCLAALMPSSFYQRNFPMFDLSHCAYPQMPSLGNLLEKSVVDIMLSLPESWSYKLHTELKEKGIAEVSRIVIDPELREKKFNLMCGPCLIMVNVYKAYHETGNVEYANKVARQMFIGE